MTKPKQPRFTRKPVQINTRWEYSDAIQLRKICGTEGRTMSEVLRFLVHIGISAYSGIPSFRVLELTDIADLVRKHTTTSQLHLVPVDSELVEAAQERLRVRTEASVIYEQGEQEGGYRTLNARKRR